MKTFKKSNKRSGQGMTEYLIIVALIAIAAVVVIKRTQGSLKAGFGNVANALQGPNHHTLTATTVTTQDTQEKDMNDF